MRRVVVMLLCLFVSLRVSEAATRVFIEGGGLRSRDELLQMLGGRLDHVRASPPSAALADDAAWMMRLALRRDGFADANVGWRIGGPDTLVLEVEQGRRLSLGKVRVEGPRPDDAARLARLYARPAERDRLLFLGPPPFRETDVELGLADIVQDLNARGHWDAAAEVVSREVEEKSGLVHTVIRVREGARFVIGTAGIECTDAAVSAMVADEVQRYRGLPATTRQLNAMRLAAEKVLLRNGYAGSVVHMARGGGEGIFVPAFRIDPGRRVRLRSLRIDGLEQTRPERITARLGDLEGDWYDQATLNDRIRGFLATGAFSSARLDTRDVAGGMVDATLHFEEAKAREIGLAVGYGTYQGPIGRLNYTDRNCGGELLGLNAGFEMSARGLLGDVRVSDPWVLGSDVAASLRGYALIYNRDGYDSYDTGVEGTALWRYGDRFSMELLLGSSVVNTHGDGLPSSELGETLYTRPRARLTPALEFRDNPVLPRNGWHAALPIEVGSAVGGVSSSYLSGGASVGWIRELGSRYQIGAGGEFGMLVPDVDGADVPIDLRLFNGGSRSVRSFPERELGPLVNGHPVGGEAMWNANLELIRDMGGPLRAVWFVDAGSLARNHEEIGSAEVEWASGLGLRLDLPIGPVRLEYGYNLTRGRDEPAGTLHFAIGHAF